MHNISIMSVAFTVAVRPLQFLPAVSLNE